MAAGWLHTLSVKSNWSLAFTSVYERPTFEMVVRLCSGMEHLALIPAGEQSSTVQFNAEGSEPTNFLAVLSVQKPRGVVGAADGAAVGAPVVSEAVGLVLGAPVVEGVLGAVVVGAAVGLPVGLGVGLSESGGYHDPEPEPDPDPNPDPTPDPDPDPDPDPAGVPAARVTPDRGEDPRIFDFR